MYKNLSAKTFRTFFIPVILLFAGMGSSVAQDYSYVYIQGDKSIPFYVKLEGEMLPRYGKNYAIISRLEPGIISLEILFQQNTYPPHTFRINVPENSNRSFLLTKRTEGFSLFDLQQGFYLQAGNDPADDQLPSGGAAYTPVAYQEQPSSAETTVSKKETKPRKETISQKPPGEKALPPAVTPGTPQFLEDIELSNEHTARANNNPATNTGSNAIPNSDCPEPVTEARLHTIHKKTLGFTTEEARLGYLNSQVNNCYSTTQAAILVQTMESNAARYSWLKKIYPRITDQSAFGSLHELFSDEAWKSHFLQIVQ